MPGVLLTQAEAAKYLGVNRDRVRAWTRDGRIPTFGGDNGERVMYPLPALEQWMREMGTDTARKNRGT